MMTHSGEVLTSIPAGASLGIAPKAPPYANAPYRERHPPGRVDELATAPLRLNGVTHDEAESFLNHWGARAARVCRTRAFETASWEPARSVEALADYEYVALAGDRRIAFVVADIDHVENPLELIANFPLRPNRIGLSEDRQRAQIVFYIDPVVPPKDTSPQLRLSDSSGAPQQSREDRQRRQVALLRAVREALTERLGADKHFSNGLSRSPLAAHGRPGGYQWHAQHEYVYSLQGEMAKHLLRKKARPALKGTGIAELLERLESLGPDRNRKLSDDGISLKRSTRSVGPGELRPIAGADGTLQRRRYIFAVAAHAARRGMDVDELRGLLRLERDQLAAAEPQRPPLKDSFLDYQARWNVERTRNDARDRPADVPVLTDERRQQLAEWGRRGGQATLTAPSPSARAKALELRQMRAARRAERILRLAAEGKTRAQISAETGLGRTTIAEALRRVGFRSNKSVLPGGPGGPPASTTTERKPHEERHTPPTSHCRELRANTLRDGTRTGSHTPAHPGAEPPRDRREARNLRALLEESLVAWSSSSGECPPRSAPRPSRRFGRLRSLGSAADFDEPP